MSAEAELQVAMVSALSAIRGFAGVFDGAPARADYPYIVINCGSEKEWSFRQRSGREIAVEVTLWDDQSARLLELEDEVQGGFGELVLGSEWQLASLSFSGKDKMRSAAGPWACSLKYRARMLRASAGDK